MPKETEILEKVGKPEEATTIDNEYDLLVAQIQAEYKLAWDNQKPKIDEAEVRLKLYNNQKRDKKAVGDTTMFTIIQTVVASLYIDRLAVEFSGREEGDEETADNLNAMAEYDYTQMEKDELDYDWIWDTCFFGRGLVELSEYERDPDNGIYLPLPWVWDPLTFLRDPRATSVNGDINGRGAARFYGSEVKMTKEDIKEHPYIFDSDFRGIKLGSGTRSLIQDAINARATAQGRESQKMSAEEHLGANAEYDITRWHTHLSVKGKVEKVRVWLANNRTKVIGMQVLERTENGKRPLWPVLDRALYPTAHDWDGTSIPDLTEDKQRARAVAQNLGINAMKGDLYPMYIYDSNRISNRNDLNFDFNKFIPMDSKDQNVADAIAPLIKARPNLALLDFIYNSLDISAQKATATPEIQQGAMSEEKRTLGEINIIASKVDTRYSLSAKIFGWSEKRFWRQWYRLYKDNFESSIDEKILRLVGAFGAKWRPLRRSNIIARLDPDVKIESQILSRAKQLEERVSFTQYFSLVLQEPTTNRRWALKKLARLNGLEKDEIERLLPPTIDERIAEDENELLNENKTRDTIRGQVRTAEVSREDDHNVHLEMHSKAGDTVAAFAHIETHKRALSIKKEKPEIFPVESEATAFTPPGSAKITPQVGGGVTRPISPSQSPGVAVQRT